MVNVIREMLHGFAAQGFEAPEALILKSHKDGMWLLRSILKTKHFRYVPGGYGKPVEHPDGSVWMEIEVQGLKVRWPALKYAQESGGYVWG